MTNKAPWWTDERRATLTQMVADKHTARQIADRLGHPSITRNSVISRARDWGLEWPSKPRMRASARKKPVKQALAKPKPKTKRLKERKDTKAPKPRMIGLLDLTSQTCRWPIGDPREPDFGFCGHGVTEENTPYCPYHHDRSTAPPYYPAAG